MRKRLEIVNMDFNFNLFMIVLFFCWHCACDSNIGIFQSGPGNLSIIEHHVTLFKDKLDYGYHACKLDTKIKEFIILFLKNIPKNVVLIFHDQTTALCVSELVDYLSYRKLGLEVIIYSIPDLHTGGRWPEVLTGVHNHKDKDGIYVLLIGLRVGVLDTLHSINILDGQSNKKTNFRHMSHWLVLTPVQSNHGNTTHDFLPATNNLENVALVDLGQHVQETILKGKYISLGGRSVALNTSVWTLQGVRSVAIFQQMFPDSIAEKALLANLFPNKKYRWNGIRIRVSTKPWYGYVIKRLVDNQTVYSGMCIKMLDVMANFLNFTYTIEDVPDGDWGTIVNGSWTGLVRQLKDRVIDLALADLGIHTSRAEVMDFVYPAYLTETIDVLFRIHEETDIDLGHLLAPLNGHIVLIMIASLCAVATLQVAVELASYWPRTRGHIARLFWESIWYHIGALFSQGGSMDPRTCSGRLVMAAWWLFAIVFAAIYSGTLTASFCIQSTVVPFRSLHEMVHTSGYKWGMLNGSINMLYFSTSTNPLYQELYGRMLQFSQEDPSVLNKDSSAQLKKVINQKYAFISSSLTLGSMMDRSPEWVRLGTLGEAIYPSGVAFGVPSESALRPGFEEVMSMMKEAGLLAHWRGLFWNRTKPSTKTFQLGGAPIPLTKLLSVCNVVTMGMASALLALVCELAVGRGILPRSRTDIRK